MKYKTKVNPINLVILAMLAVAIALVAVLMQQGALKIFLLVLASLIFVYYLIGIFYHYYTFTDKYVLIVNGLVRTKVFYFSVKKIEETSFSMVKISKDNVFGKYYVIPKNKEEFIRELKIRCENCED